MAGWTGETASTPSKGNKHPIQVNICICLLLFFFYLLFYFEIFLDFFFLLEDLQIISNKMTICILLLIFFILKKNGRFIYISHMHAHTHIHTHTHADKKKHTCGFFRDGMRLNNESKNNNNNFSGTNINWRVGRCGCSSILYNTEIWRMKKK